MTGRAVAIGEVATLNPKPPALSEEGARALVPFIPMAAVLDDGRVDEHECRPVAELVRGHTYFEKGDVLLAKITPCFENGKAAHLDSLPHPFGFGSTEFHVLRAGPDIDPRYLYHAVRNPRFRQAGASSMTGSAGQQRVPAAFVARYRVPLPPLAEQRRIAGVLDKADAIRRKRRKSMWLLGEFLRSGFLEMFGDPVRNEKGWEVVRLGQVADIQGGLQVTARRGSNPVEVPYLRVANVYRDALDLLDVKKLRVTHQELERTRLRPNDVLVVEGHGNRSEIGRSAVWDGSIEPCVHQNHLIRLRLDSTVAEPVYVSAFLNSAGGQRQMFRFGKTTSGLNTISTGNVRLVEIMLPPVDVQRRYALLQLQVRVSYRHVEAAQRDADRLFGSLVQRHFCREL